MMAMVALPSQIETVAALSCPSSAHTLRVMARKDWWSKRMAMTLIVVGSYDRNGRVKTCVVEATSQRSMPCQTKLHWSRQIAHAKWRLLTGVID
jgi:hypothetical protein